MSFELCRRTILRTLASTDSSPCHLTDKVMSWFLVVDTSWFERLQEPSQIARLDADNAAFRAVDVRDTPSRKRIT